MQATISNLEQAIAAKSAAYDFKGGYDAMRRRLTILKNASVNYDVARRGAVYRYLSVRNGGCSKSYLSGVRQTALAELQAIKLEFAGLL